MTHDGPNVLGRTIFVFAGSSLAWEIVQLPLYTIWWTDPPGRIAFAVLHCTIGDLMIGAAALAVALLVAGRGWPRSPGAALRVGVLATVIGLAYTVYSEWANLARGNWAYTASMPVLPPFGTGLTPALQWLVLPPLALFLAHRMLASRAATRDPSVAKEIQQVQ